jgi:hypothetical protein
MGLVGVRDLVGALLPEDVLHRVGREQLHDERRRRLRPRIHCNTRAWLAVDACSDGNNGRAGSILLVGATLHTHTACQV